MDGKELSRRKLRSRNSFTHRPELPRFSSVVNIPADAVAALFRCGKCEVAPIKPPAYTCRNGHLNCGACYRKLSRDCYKCKEPLLGRNQVLEEVMRGLPIQACVALSDCSVPLRESRSEQSLQISLQDPSLLEKLELARQEAERQERSRDPQQRPEPKSSPLYESKSNASNSNHSSNTSLDSFQIRSSARPLSCPFPCGRIVTCSSLLPHFEFHHPHVLLYKIRKNCNVKFKIPYIDIKNTDEEEGRCIIFFVVRIDDKDEDSDEETVEKSADLLKVTRKSQEMVQRGYFVALLTAGRLPNPLDEDSWFLVTWVTALYDFAPMTYTLRASDDSGTHSFSFEGPPTSLHKDQRPKEVYRRGECLTVPPALLRGFRDVGDHLVITINFQSDLPFPFDPPASTYHWNPNTPVHSKSHVL